MATATPVDTLIEWDDVCMVYQTPRDVALGVCHMVYYKESWKRTVAIINFATLTAVLTEQKVTD